jgi:hypothetical protein
MNLKDAINSPAFSHARQGDRCWRDVVWIYHRDPVSPSGVKLADIDHPYTKEEADALLRTRGTSPLSPTERVAGYEKPGHWFDTNTNGFNDGSDA